MKLNGSELRELHKALLLAFPERADLERTLHFAMEVRLGEIADAGSISDAYYRLLVWAQAEAAWRSYFEHLPKRVRTTPTCAAFCAKQVPK